jgi:ferrous iron transport protein A
VPTLDTLHDGQVARIRDVVGDDAIAVRLMEMGLTDGEIIELVGRAPLGDPIEFQIRGYRLSLRSEEARRVLIDSAD